MYKTIIPQTHDEWLKERAKGIGSSEISALLGVNPWLSAYQLWQEKTGKVTRPEDDSNLRLRAGHSLENEVATAFERVVGLPIETATEGDWIAADLKRPHLRVSPDRLYRTSDGGLGVLECKTTSRPLVEVPAGYFCQVQYQLAVTGYSEAYLGVLDLLQMGEDWGGFKAFRIAADPKFQAFILDKADRFWTENVLRDVPPAPVCYKDVVSAFPTSVAGKDVEISDEVAEAVVRLKETNAEIKRLEGVAQKLKDSVVCAIGDGERLIQTVEGGAPKVWATFKTQTSRRVDTDKLKNDFPDVYDGCAKETTSRVLRLK